MRSTSITSEDVSQSHVLLHLFEAWAEGVGVR